MIRGTTPTVRLRVYADLMGCDEIHVAFNSRKINIVKEYPEDVTRRLSDGQTVLETTLTQDDTLMFKDGAEVTVQVRCREGDRAYSSNIYTLVESVGPIIEEGVI